MFERIAGTFMSRQQDENAGSHQYEEHCTSARNGSMLEMPAVSSTLIGTPLPHLCASMPRAQLTRYS
jgi:hypothetical protein